MLAEVQPPAKRFKVAQSWLNHNQQRCSYGGMIYVQNRAPRVLGAAYQRPLEVLMWGLMAPTAPKQQAVKSKRRL